MKKVLPALRFKEFEFHGFLGKRRTVSFGWHYDFNGGGLKQAGELPQFLLPLRKRAAEFASLEPSALEHVLLTEYRPGAGIGWHRDRPQFGDVIGISLLAPCTSFLRQGDILNAAVPLNEDGKVNRLRSRTLSSGKIPTTRAGPPPDMSTRHRAAPRAARTPCTSRDPRRAQRCAVSVSAVQVDSDLSTSPE